MRWSENEKLIVFSNFDAWESYCFELKIPQGTIQEWSLKEGSFKVKDALYDKTEKELKVIDGIGKLNVEIAPLESYIFKLLD